MKPSSPFFKNRFIIALNTRLKKVVPEKADYSSVDMQSKIQAVAMTVLQDMGVKDYSVLVGIQPRADGKANLSISFHKFAQMQSINTVEKKDKKKNDKSK